MRYALPFLVLLLACRGDDAVPGEGRLEIDGEPGGRLIEASARGMACARDTTAAIVAISTHWSAAVSMRALLPAGERELPIRGNLDDSIPSAMVGLRALSDTMIAMVADSGSLRLLAGDSLAGSFEAWATRDSMRTRLTGRFSVPLPVDACP